MTITTKRVKTLLIMEAHVYKKSDVLSLVIKHWKVRSPSLASRLLRKTGVIVREERLSSPKRGPRIRYLTLNISLQLLEERLQREPLPSFKDLDNDAYEIVPLATNQRSRLKTSRQYLVEIDAKLDQIIALLIK